jgi:hypothetical protein
MRKCQKACDLNWIRTNSNTNLGKLRCLNCGTVYAKNIKFQIARAAAQAHMQDGVDRHQQLHEMFMHLTAKAPCKTIVIDGLPYLERYYMGDVTISQRRTRQHWLHRFLRCSSEDLHTHAWEANSTVVTGWYLEETPGGIFTVRKPGDNYTINLDTIHRVAAALPDTWTSLMVRPGLKETWDFVAGDGSRTAVQSGGPDWWKECLPRAAA